MFTVEIDGLNELAAEWDRAVGDIDGGLVRGVRDGCDEGADEARRTHRFTNRTGTLEGSINGRVTSTAASAPEGVLEATAPYALFVEEGWEHHPEPDGFMARGAAKAESVAIDRVEHGIEAAKARMEK